ncbi:hypothetical protein BDY24DRAFT_391603 [Mrakia frigida]|uniref:uncharacterized protein n=1 Tax=Mrakia frigida TaxID=29902 RepID=UPI003FCBF914
MLLAIEVLELFSLTMSQPSLLPSSSRLRSSIGVHRLRNLSFDLDRPTDDPRLEEISALVQPSVWKQAHRRISSAPPPHSISKKFSFISYESDTVVRDVVNILSTIIPRHNGIFQIAFASQALSPSGSIDLLWTGSRPSRLLSSRALYVTSVPLERAEMITLDSKEKSAKIVREDRRTYPTLSWKMDLRRVVLVSHGDAEIVATAARSLLGGEDRFECTDMSVEFLVASEEVGKVVEKVVREWEKEERVTRCSVVRSSQRFLF